MIAAGDSTPTSLPFPIRRRLLRIAVAGAVMVVLVIGAGTAMAWWRLGSTEDAARRQVAANVRSSFDRMAQALRDIAARAATTDVLQRAAGGDTVAARQLFASAAAAVGGEDSDVAVTVYAAADLRPVAWAGRTSELPRERLQGAEAWFVAPDVRGLRLVYVAPRVAGASRVGTVAAERSLAPADPPPAGRIQPTSDIFRISTPLSRIGIELPFERAGTNGGAETFEVTAPSGQVLLQARVTGADLAATRASWRRATRSLALMATALTILLLAGPLLDWRNRSRSWRPYATATACVAAAIVLARGIALLASPADWSAWPIFSGVEYASRLGLLFGSPLDFLLTAAAGAGLVALALFVLEAWRVDIWRRRHSVSRQSLPRFLATQLAAGGVLALILVGHRALVTDTIEHTRLDLLHFSLHPWTTGPASQHIALLALHVGLLLVHAMALALAIGVLRGATIGWRIPRGRSQVRMMTVAAWALPVVIWLLTRGLPLAASLPALAALIAVIGLTLYGTRLMARFRHGSQAFRLTLLTLALIVPAGVLYPTLFQLAWDAKLEMVKTTFAPQAINQRETVHDLLDPALLRKSLDPLIDELAELETLGTIAADERGPRTDLAFQVWQATRLATYPVTSSVELYNASGALVSRFAFNLPEDPTPPPASEERGCRWQLFEEVAPFFAEERRVLHAGRQICRPTSDGRPGSSSGEGGAIGSIVLHAMVDDPENLPFNPSRSPYVELLRPADRLREEGNTGRDVEYAVYGWSRRPLYSSGDTAWELDDAVFQRIAGSRVAFWAELRRGATLYEVYLQNNRGGIYALGVPIVSALGHLVNLAELTALAGATYVLLLLGNAAFALLGRRSTTAPALLREIRASFYRKLFIAFVLAAFVPVVVLAVVTRNYVADEMRGNIEQEAIRTAAAARRVVEDLVAPQAAQQGAALDDNLMVWVSRLVNQDVNIFRDARLEATSERNLYASGQLPTRTPADVYAALELRQNAAAVTRERIGSLEYLVAAAPLTVRNQFTGTLTVPLTSRQQEIDGQIDTLDRRVLLGVLFFVLVGAGLGYGMAERISDPVNRLTRATRRIARGDLDARIAATSSDELRRLVEDFNSMAAELQRQRRELERTHRLEAWAEMARQVAHEIKNPLTPIQLNAEHLRRVHADRGEPMSPILQDCVATILTQVKLLRQIASDFSNFASSPTARRAPVDPGALLHEIVDPYRAGLAEKITLVVDVPANLPAVEIDRTLIARSLTNVVENALHAMPSGGTLTIRARAGGGHVRITIADTGVGMDAEALARAFEPYFSTKASGTGLGLPIAKRNVELSGGTVSVASERDQGTTVAVVLPVVPGEDSTG